MFPSQRWSQFRAPQTEWSDWSATRMPTRWVNGATAAIKARTVSPPRRLRAERCGTQNRRARPCANCRNCLRSATGGASSSVVTPLGSSQGVRPVPQLAIVPGRCLDLALAPPAFAAFPAVRRLCGDSRGRRYNDPNLSSLLADAGLGRA